MHARHECSSLPNKNTGYNGSNETDTSTNHEDTRHDIWTLHSGISPLRACVYFLYHVFRCWQLATEKLVVLHHAAELHVTHTEVSSLSSHSAGQTPVLLFCHVLLELQLEVHESLWLCFRICSFRARCGYAWRTSSSEFLPGLLDASRLGYLRSFWMLAFYHVTFSRRFFSFVSFSSCAFLTCFGGVFAEHVANFTFYRL